jgi:hypothetical protein
MTDQIETPATADVATSRVASSKVRMLARGAIKVVTVIAAALLLLIGVTVAVNSFDEPLSAEARALQSAPPDPYKPEENIYVALAGFDAPAGQSIIDAGQAKVGHYDQALESIIELPDANSASATVADPNALKFNSAVTYCTSGFRASDIWTDVASHKDDVAVLLAANQELMRRYSSLHRLRGYYDTSRPSYLVPRFYVPPPLRCLFLSDIALKIRTGSLPQQQAALDDLSGDVRMWREVLRGEGTLTSKMIAIGSLQGDFTVLAGVISDPAIDPAVFGSDQPEVLTPFDPADWKIGKAFAAEYRVEASFYRHIASTLGLMTDAPVAVDWQPDWKNAARRQVATHFFKINATLNQYARQMSQLGQLADSDPAKFSSARGAFDEWLEKNGSKLSPTAIFNPLGKFSVWVSAPADAHDILSVYDVAAFQRLLFLAYQMRRQGIEPSGVLAYVAQHREWYTHPIDNRPFQWTPRLQRLAVAREADYAGSQLFSVTVGRPQSKN